MSFPRVYLWCHGDACVDQQYAERNQINQLTCTASVEQSLAWLLYIADHSTCLLLSSRCLAAISLQFLRYKSRVTFVLPYVSSTSARSKRNGGVHVSFAIFVHVTHAPFVMSRCLPEYSDVRLSLGYSSMIKRTICNVADHFPLLNFIRRHDPTSEAA
jgi:hypothetical protein